MDKTRLTPPPKQRKIEECTCNFNPPHPLRLPLGEYKYVDFIPQIEEFFCSFCNGLITNDMRYIEEVISFHASERAYHWKDDPHHDHEEDVKEGIDIYSKQYKKLLNLL